LDGEKAGRYTVTKPLIGFKKIQCSCTGKSGLFWNPDIEHQIDGIAKLEIQVGAIIIRPKDVDYSKIGTGNYYRLLPGKNLRTALKKYIYLHTF